MDVNHFNMLWICWLITMACWICTLIILTYTRDKINVIEKWVWQFYKIDSGYKHNIVLPTIRPPFPTEGSLYYDKDLNLIMIYHGEKWQEINKMEKFIVINEMKMVVKFVMTAAIFGLFIFTIAFITFITFF